MTYPITRRVKKGKRAKPHQRTAEKEKRKRKTGGRTRKASGIPSLSVSAQAMCGATC